MCDFGIGDNGYSLGGEEGDIVLARGGFGIWLAGVAMAEWLLDTIRYAKGQRVDGQGPGSRSAQSGRLIQETERSGKRGHDAHTLPEKHQSAEHTHGVKDGGTGSPII